MAVATMHYCQSVYIRQTTAEPGRPLILQLKGSYWSSLVSVFALEIAIMGCREKEYWEIQLSRKGLD